MPNFGEAIVTRVAPRSGSSRSKASNAPSIEGAQHRPAGALTDRHGLA